MTTENEKPSDCFTLQYTITVPHSTELHKFHVLADILPFLVGQDARKTSNLVCDTLGSLSSAEDMTENDSYSHFLI